MAGRSSPQRTTSLGPQHTYPPIDLAIHSIQSDNVLDRVAQRRVRVCIPLCKVGGKSAGMTLSVEPHNGPYWVVENANDGLVHQRRRCHPRTWKRTSRNSDLRNAHSLVGYGCQGAVWEIDQVRVLSKTSFGIVRGDHHEPVRHADGNRHPLARIRLHDSNRVAISGLNCKRPDPSRYSCHEHGAHCGDKCRPPPAFQSRPSSPARASVARMGWMHMVSRGPTTSPKAHDASLLMACIAPPHSHGLSSPRSSALPRDAGSAYSSPTSSPMSPTRSRSAAESSPE